MSDEIQGIRERELRELATCILCQKKIGQQPIPAFYVLTIEHHGLDFAAIQRQTGLEQMLGGCAFVAQAMGPDEPMTKPLSERYRVTVCQRCAFECVVGEVMERAEHHARNKQRE